MQLIKMTEQNIRIKLYRSYHGGLDALDQLTGEPIERVTARHKDSRSYSIDYIGGRTGKKYRCTLINENIRGYDRVAEIYHYISLNVLEPFIIFMTLGDAKKSGFEWYKVEILNTKDNRYKPAKQLHFFS
jgi:outer membrane protein assembly factor BamB